MSPPLDDGYVDYDDGTSGWCIICDDIDDELFCLSNEIDCIGICDGNLSLIHI